MSNYLEDRAKVLDNILLLQERVDICTGIGMEDSESKLYNETITLLDELDEINDYVELNEIILQAQSIEKRLDVWLSSKGQNTVSLNWPQIPL